MIKVCSIEPDYQDISPDGGGGGGAVCERNKREEGGNREHEIMVKNCLRKMSNQNEI
jgi:hypothetical protein